MLCRYLHTRLKGYHPHPSHVAFAFDIDGVLIRGARAIPRAREALQLLQSRKIPFILLTNGGGVKEQIKASEICSKLEIELEPKQVVLSHTPMQQLVQKYKNRPVLVIGKDSCKQVALTYGFEKPVTSDEILSWNPHIWPFKVSNNEYSNCLANLNEEGIAAIMVYHDSLDWGRDIQIMCDVLNSSQGKIGTESIATQEIPLYFSNSDFLWSNEFPQPRFAQGAFRHALESIYKRLHGNELEYKRFGKPELVQYQFAHEILVKLSKDLWPDERFPVRIVYAIGDNPASDILGANSFGWRSLLVKTGVWRESHGHDHGADHVAHDVFEAVEEALSRQGLY